MKTRIVPHFYDFYIVGDNVNKRRTKESLIRRYLHLPPWVRRKTDKVFKKKRGFDEKVNRKAVKGKIQFRQILSKGLKELFG